MRSKTYEFCRWVTDLTLLYATESILNNKQAKESGWTNRKTVRNLYVPGMIAGIHGPDKYDMVDFDPNDLSLAEMKLLNFSNKDHPRHNELWRIPLHLFPYIRANSRMCDMKGEFFNFDPKSSPKVHKGLHLEYGILA